MCVVPPAPAERIGSARHQTSKMAAIRAAGPATLETAQSAII